ncbi:MAG TPA: NADP-dependent oxidoreductase [Chloroflexia bacterium]|nr:NADP-dependent oxidoreductase [Chloroflexia bacterium]
MKAVRIIEWGQPVQIEDVPQPAPGSDEVLVRVRAAALNPFDLAVVAGYVQSMLNTPMTPGTDLAGEVVEVGADVTDLKPGDEVFGYIPMRGGAFAEYAIAKPNELTLKPRSLDYVQAASVPLTSLTAWQSLFDVAQLQSGERLLIHGAGGAVGSFGAQFAREKGAYVIGTASAEKAPIVQEAGVDQYINYQEERFEDVVSDVDVVLITARSEDLVTRSFDVMKPGGRLVASSLNPSAEEAEARGLRASGIMSQPNPDQLTTIAEMIDAGKIKVFVDHTFPLDEAQAAYDLLQTGKNVGKVVLTVG